MIDGQRITLDARNGFDELKVFCDVLDRAILHRKGLELRIRTRRPRRFGGFDETQIVSNSLIRSLELLQPVLEGCPEIKVFTEHL